MHDWITYLVRYVCLCDSADLPLDRRDHEQHGHDSHDGNHVCPHDDVR